MILTTTSGIDLPNTEIVQYHGLVYGDVIIGANIFRDIFAGLRDIIGGRSGNYERVLNEARVEALRELEAAAQRLGANAVVGLKLDFGSVGHNNSMLMVSCTGTAVTYR